MSQKRLLSIIEIGGYPDFTPLYTQRGLQVSRTDSMRKAVKLVKKEEPDIIVAEFNYQSDFRDRTSSLETLMATVQRLPHSRVIVFYEKEQRKQLERLLAVFPVFATIPFPVDNAELGNTIDRALLEMSA